MPHAIAAGREMRAIDETSRYSFETLLRNHHAILFRIANTYCWLPDDRADLAQEIAAQLWRAWPSYDPTRSISTWIYRIALNVAISYVRKESERRKHSVPFDEELHETTAPHNTVPDQADRITRLQKFIQQQLPLDRALLLLYLEEKPQKEIAEILGITITNVSTKISRLKQRIRAEI